MWNLKELQKMLIDMLIIMQWLMAFVELDANMFQN